MKGHGQAAVYPHSWKLGEGLKETRSSAKVDALAVIKLCLLRILLFPTQILIRRISQRHAM